MRHFIKVYLTSILLLVIGLTVYGVTYITVIDREAVVFQPIGTIIADIKTDIEADKNLTPLERAMKESSRINTLVVGKEGVRTDTIMVVSYDKKEKIANILSIPRDTYYERDGVEIGQRSKINAVYQDEGITGTMKAVEDITGIPINKYVEVDYDAVIKAVDAIGGVEIDIPIDMYYDDPYDTPPLHIYFTKGLQTLDGEAAMRFLRFRKNNDGTGYYNGDLGRIQTQQHFIKVAMSKALSLKLPNVVKEVVPYIHTNYTLTELLGLASSAAGFDMSNLQADTIPNNVENINGLSFVKCDEVLMEDYVYNMYGVEKELSSDGFVVDIKEEAVPEQTPEEAPQQ